eukprot:g11083.t1
MGRSSFATAALAGMLLLAHGDVPKTSAFVPPTAAGALQRLPSRQHYDHSSRKREALSLAGHRKQGGAAAAETRTAASNNCNMGGPCGGSSSRSNPTCCAASFSSGEDALAGPSTISSLPGAVSSAAVVDERKERKEGGGVQEAEVEVGRNASWDGGGGLIPIPVAAAARPAAGDAGEAAATSGVWGVEERSLEPELEWEGDEGAAWTEFEDWLVQDTYSRYAIGSGKYVLWRRMVREVPELMERTPQEARRRWLRLTGRLGGGIDGQGGREEEGGAGSPVLDTYYVQPPVLEQWEEIVEGDGIGSFRGNVFGQRGLADGTAMTTAPVDVSGKKIQDQYVATQCGVVYELGERRETDIVVQASSKMLKIAPATVLALAGAFYALTALSHHVQVEVFVI